MIQPFKKEHGLFMILQEIFWNQCIAHKKQTIKDIVRFYGENCEITLRRGIAPK